MNCNLGSLILETKYYSNEYDRHQSFLISPMGEVICVTPVSVQRLFSSLSSGITPGHAQGTIWRPGLEPGSATGKASALSAVTITLGPEFPKFLQQKN